MTFEVLDPGLFTTIQDPGRPGYGAYGVPEGGALDRSSHLLANRLAGNRAEAPTLEFALRGPRLRWGGRLPVRCALVGDGAQAITVKPGAIVECGVLRQSARGYFAAAGGFYARPVMGSASTCVVGGFGGLLGRALQAQDKLDLVSGRRRGHGDGGGGYDAHSAMVGAEVAEVPPGDTSSASLRVLEGPAAARLGATALTKAPWTVADGDRVGLRLSGPRLRVVRPQQSLPLCPGCVQVTGAGQPILLLREHPTVGGYPVVAVVIEADLDLAAQLRPGSLVRFMQVDEGAALRALRRLP